MTYSQLIVRMLDRFQILTSDLILIYFFTNGKDTDSFIPYIVDEGS